MLNTVKNCNLLYVSIISLTDRPQEWKEVKKKRRRHLKNKNCWFYGEFTSLKDVTRSLALPAITYISKQPELRIHTPCLFSSMPWISAPADLCQIRLRSPNVIVRNIWISPADVYPLVMTLVGVWWAISSTRRFSNSLREHGLPADGDHPLVFFFGWTGQHLLSQETILPRALMCQLKQHDPSL